MGTINQWCCIFVCSVSEYVDYDVDSVEIVWVIRHIIDGTDVRNLQLKRGAVCGATTGVSSSKFHMGLFRSGKNRGKYRLR